MFVFTTKITKAKLIGAVIAVAAVLILVIILVSSAGSGGERESEPGVSGDHSVIAIKSNDDRVAYLTSMGWDVSLQPMAAEEIKIPDEFDEVYNKYNELQKSQNYDLEKYKGKRVKRYTYEIKNYPTGEEGVVANLLVYRENVIGGDISSVSLDGFMHGLAKSR